LILRGANDYMLDEMDRALHDALSIVKRTLESNTVSLHSLPLDPIWGQLSCPMKTNKFFMRMEFTK
jgi:hypothetical protein